MYSSSIHCLLLAAVAVATPLQGRSSLPIDAITPTQWAALNQTVGGRLYRGVPLAKPCYSLYNGTANVPDSAQCSAVQNGYTADTYLASSYAGWMNTNWASCQATAQACNLDYSVPQNPLVYAPPNNCYQGSISTYYIKVQAISDIQAALAFSRKTKVPLTIKNSGHDYKGRSSAPGSLALWTYNVQPTLKLTKNFVPDGCSTAVGDGVTMGAGQAFLGLFQFAEANNITIVGGSSETVGAAGGWISGAGHSALANTLGLGVDNVMQIRTVLPNGTYITANACQNQDIFFALRGGGGGTFGVNWEMTTRAHPHKTLQVAYIRFASTDPTSVRKFITIVIQNALKWAQDGWGGYIEPGVASQQTSGLVLMTPKLNHTDAVASMKPMTDYVASLGNLVLNNQVDTVNSFYQAYQTYLVPNEEKVGLGTAMGTRLIPDTNLNNPADQQALVETLVTINNMVAYPYLDPNPEYLNFSAPMQLLMTTPYNYNLSTDTSSITPAWRNAVIHAQAYLSLPNTPTVAEIKKVFQVAHNATQMLTALTPGSGAYSNEADTFQDNPEETFWGRGNYDKLLGIKKQVDPNNLLTCHSCIGWDATDTRYSCYPSIA